MDNKQQHIQTAPSSEEEEQDQWYQTTEADIESALCDDKDDLYKFITKEEVEDIERAYEGQVEQQIDYHIG